MSSANDGSVGPRAGNFDYTDTVDPTVVGYQAPLGSTYRYVPQTGTPAFYQKTSDPATGWTLVGGGGGPVTGDPNTLAYFNGLGNLSDNTVAKFDESKNAMAFGSGGNVNATEYGALAHGLTDVLPATISALGVGSYAAGSADIDSSIIAELAGSFVFGVSTGPSSLIHSSKASLAGGSAESGGIITCFNGPNGTSGNIAFGHASNDGLIQMHTSIAGPASFGSVVIGSSDGVGSRITANRAQGCLVVGRAGAGGNINITNNGSFIHGYALGGGEIRITNGGCQASGQSNGVGSLINVNSIGGKANGRAENGGIIQAITGSGGLAFGYASNSQISSISHGSFASGQVQDGPNGGSSIRASSSGAIANGYGSDLGQVLAAGAGSHAHGNANTVGTIRATGEGSHCFGLADTADALIETTANANGGSASGRAFDAGLIQSANNGAMSSGHAETSGVISANGKGSQSFGESVGLNSVINSVASGSSAHGYAINGGVIGSSAEGSSAVGVADGAGSLISSSQQGAGAFGQATLGGVIQATNAGSHAFGVASNQGAISANADGSLVFGMSDGNTSQIRSVGNPSFAFGSVGSAGVVTSSGDGSMAHGTASGAGVISSSGNGSIARGFCINNSQIVSSNDGSVAFGRAQNTFNILSSGRGSYAGGSTETGSIIASGLGAFALGDNLNVTADLAAAFGLGNAVSTYQALVIGQFAEPFAGSPNTWVATEPAFVVGNGTGVGTEADAYRLDKDGKIHETGAKRLPARLITTNDTLSGRTDRVVIMNDNTASVNTLNLPAGEEGLYFKIGATAANSGTWTLVPLGGDTVDAAISGALSAPTEIVFIGGTWYQVA